VQQPVLAELVKLTSKVPSPCIQVCTVIDGICIGCERSAKEITEWLRATDERKLEILERIGS
jgi:predicted Fe-S protein YdhL (DUF1289 family)